MDKSKRFIGSLFFFLLLWVLGLSFIYFSLPKKLFPHHSYSTVLLDRNNEFLSASISKDEQWHFPRNSIISEKYKEASILFEDKRFYRHNGFDVLALIRATLSNIKARKIVSGASTISMQVIRMHRNNPPRTFSQKLVEIFLAQRLEWSYSKEQIFDLYAANAPYGGNVIGIDAASWRFFGKSSENISWAEASLLAVLPNSPGLLHIEKNREKLQYKRDRLLTNLYEEAYIDDNTYRSALQEVIPRRPKRIENLSPQLLHHLRNKSGPALYRTSLNKQIQIKCLEIADVQGELLKQNHIDNLSILVLDIEKNETLAYIGNLRNTGLKNQEYVDIIQAKRSTGSLLKPFLYAAAIDRGIILEKSLLPDYPIQMNGFITENYHKKHDGLVPANKALTRSLNIPFAYLLQQYGIERFRLLLQSYGLQSINKSADYYGIPLILGGAESSLWELTNAYGILAKTLISYDSENGYYSEADFSDCTILASRKAQASEKKMKAAPISLRAESVWKALNTIQNVERPNEQGMWDKFSSSHRISWKTGTSNGFKDAWAIGVNGKYAIGVWVGNADGEGRPGIIGSKVAAPIFFRVVNSLTEHSWFEKPIDDMHLMALCSTSGNLPSTECPIDSQYIGSNNLELPICKNHRLIFVDQKQNYEVNAGCYDMTKAYAKNIFQVNSKAAYYYKQNAFYESPPPLHPHCVSESNSLSPTIIYPEKGIQIYLPKIDKGKRNKLVLRAFHPSAKMKLHWHINEKYYGSTQSIHEKSIALKAGRHELIVIDDTGNEDRIHFEVIE